MSTASMSAPGTRPRAADFLHMLRPSQWTKNLLVAAAFFFAYFDRSRAAPLALADLARVIPAVALFCVVSSGIYVVNDLRDRDADRQHPVKRNRPIASGRVPLPAALVIGHGLLLAGLLAAYALAPRFAALLGVYILIQFAYTQILKRVALVDIMVIAVGFVLRAIAGGIILADVTISPWLLLCTFLLALFLALCKRRHEKRLLEDDTGALHRNSLAGYDPHLLDQLIAITAGATIVSYAIYTLWPQTVLKFGTSALGFTIPFVVFGIFRYLDLVYRHEQGDRPERILLTDIPILINIALYGASVVVICLLTQ